MQLLQKLLDNQLYIKAEKCDFHASTVSFLGYVVTANKVQMDPDKVSAVANWPTPDSRKKVQQFLGFVNFYRKFIRNFDSVATPLHALTSSKIPFQWNPQAEKAFQCLKERFTTAPVLTVPDPQRQFVVEVDSSNEGIGVVLSQRSAEDNRLHPCAYLSRKLSPADRNYNVGKQGTVGSQGSIKRVEALVRGGRTAFSSVDRPLKPGVHQKSEKAQFTLG